jgi:hypothetical protein
LNVSFWTLIGSVAGTLFALSSLVLTLYHATASETRRLADKFGLTREAIEPYFALMLDALALFFVPFAMALALISSSNLILFVVTAALLAAAVFVLRNAFRVPRGVFVLWDVVSLLMIAASVLVVFGIRLGWPPLFGLHANAEVVGMASLIGALFVVLLGTSHLYRHKGAYYPDEKFKSLLEGKDYQRLREKVAVATRRWEFLQGAASELRRRSLWREEYNEPYTTFRMRYSDLQACDGRLSEKLDALRGRCAKHNESNRQLVFLDVCLSAEALKSQLVEQADSFIHDSEELLATFRRALSSGDTGDDR